MKNIAHKIECIVKTSFLVAAFLIISSTCEGREWSRGGNTEIIGLYHSMRGDTTSGLGATMEVGNTTAYGIGYGNNINSHLNINMDLWIGSTSTIVKVSGGSVQGDTSLFGGDFNLDLNLLKKRFTPFVTGGVGFINFSGDFLGFIFDETDYSYNYGGGLRWDATNHLLFKAGYRATKTRMKDTDSSIVLDGLTFSVGYIF